MDSDLHKHTSTSIIIPEHHHLDHFAHMQPGYSLYGRAVCGYACM